jgi:hypothetical protein
MAVMRRPVGGLVLGFVCVLALGLAPQASVAGSGGFSPTSSMTGPRPGAATAPLPDGRVLQAGGASASGDFDPPYFGRLQSAEIFDPPTNTFSPTGSMSEVRSGAFAAPLPGGNVLVAGGYGAGPLSSAEIYDPTTGTFSPTGSMSESHLGGFAVPLGDGRVLIAGGDSDSSAEIFDPATGTFSSAGIGSMSVPRAGATAAPLPDGRVLVAGGYNAIIGGGHGFPDYYYDQSSAEVFDPATNSFRTAGIGSMSVPREGAVSVPLTDGRILVAGAGSGSQPTSMTRGLSRAPRCSIRPRAGSAPLGSDRCRSRVWAL